MKEKQALEYFSWFDGREYPNKEIKLKEGGIITNVSKFVDSHLPIARLNYKNKRYLPYVQRLDQVRKAIEKDAKRDREYNKK